MFFLFTYVFLFIFFQISDLFNSRFHEESNLNILDATQVFDSHQIKDYFAFFSSNSLYVHIYCFYLPFLHFVFPSEPQEDILNSSLSTTFLFRVFFQQKYFFCNAKLFVLFQTKLFYDAKLFVRDIYLCYLAYTIKCSRCLMFCSLYIIICS